MRIRTGFFSLKLTLAMAERGISGSKLAQTVECSYEHIRKILRCEAFPSTGMLHQLCRVLRMNHAELRRLAVLDQCRAKYGPSFWTLLGLKPENDEFYVLYYFLTDEQRQNFMVQMEATVRGRK